MAVSVSAAGRNVSQGTFLADNGEYLYNGVRLPVSPWPPTNITKPDMNLDGSLNLGVNPVITAPYLASPPASIVVRTLAGVGGRQLFVDDFLIASTDMTRTWHTATPHGGNPVMAPGETWEDSPEAEAPGSYGGRVASPYSDGIWWDAGSSLYKALYQASYGKYTCYATSPDLVTWTKPDLGGGNNIVLTHFPLINPILPGRDAASFWRDDDEPDANRRWKFIYTEPHPTDNNWRLALVYAAVPTGPWSSPVYSNGFGGYSIGDRTTLHFNRFRQRWVYGIKTAESGIGARRNRHYYETPTSDLMAHVYTGDVMWNRVDDLEEAQYVAAGGLTAWRPQLYNFDVMHYESVMVGWRTLLTEDGAGARPKLNRIYSSFSRDGFHFSNSYHLTVGDLNPTPQTWNYGNMHTILGIPIVDQDRICLLVSGRSGIPGDTNGSMGDASMGLFTMRRDGFCSMGATGAEKTLTTRRLRFYSGTKFYVNARANGGSVEVEVIHEPTGVPYANFTKALSSTISSDTTWSEVTWGAAISTLVGEPVAFRFYCTNADLYAFGVTDNSGNAGGYVHIGRT